MALVIRFTRMGRKGERKFRIVVKEKRSKRDGKAVDILGSYVKTINGVTKDINKDKVKYWISKGAQPTPAVKEIL